MGGVGGGFLGALFFQAFFLAGVVMGLGCIVSRAFLLGGVGGGVGGGVSCQKYCIMVCNCIYIIISFRDKKQVPSV